MAIDLNITAGNGCPAADRSIYRSRPAVTCV